MSFSTELFLEYKKRPGKPALARLLENHQDALYSLCRQVLRHPQDAEDACQEILLELSRKVDSIAEPERFSGWLYRTALHTALDLKRQRGRRQVREAGARRDAETAPQEAHDALHEGLARLDDTTRQLVVEHYFARRPLRELAAERGCSEVAVWKRIQGARERLRQTLGSAALSALDGIDPLRAPAGLAKKALLQGGLTMAASGGIKLAIVAPLLLLAGAGTLLMARRSLPPPTEAAAKASAEITAPRMSSAASAVPPPAAGRPVDPATKASLPARRPYPFNAKPIPPEKSAAARTWAILSSARISIDEENKPVAEFLGRLARELGLTIIVDPVTGHQAGHDTATFKVQNIVIDACLRLLLQPRGRAYEIRADGSIHVGKQEDVPGGYELEARSLPNLQGQLEAARGYLNQAADGKVEEAPKTTPDPRALKIRVPQGETTLEGELRRLEDDYGLRVRVESPAGSIEGYVAWRNLMQTRFLQLVEEPTAEEHVQQLARQAGLVALHRGREYFTLTTEDRAQQFRAQEEEERRQDAEVQQTFGKVLPESGTLSVQDLVDGMARVSGWEVVPSEEVWNSGAAVMLPPGTTLREGLDALKAQGFRWGRYFGKVFIVK
jgi:RNA polymerase sigma-70 factor (ECF subfamily)